MHTIISQIITINSLLNNFAFVGHLTR